LIAEVGRTRIAARKEQDMNNIAKIISTFGGAKGIYASLDNPPYMRLVIEDIGQGPRGHQAISVAHYFEQNGELCCRAGLKSRTGHWSVKSVNGGALARPSEILLHLNRKRSSG
jgi:hypothetical protein